MQIALIGASGATGRHVCRLARAAGHTVRAYSRTGRPIEGQDVANQPLDATDPDAVAAAVAGADAIVSVIGGELDTRSDGIAALVTAAKRHGITRLIAHPRRARSAALRAGAALRRAHALLAPARPPRGDGCAALGSSASAAPARSSPPAAASPATSPGSPR